MFQGENTMTTLPFWVEIGTHARGGNYTSYSRVVQMAETATSEIHEDDPLEIFVGPFFTREAAEYYRYHGIQEERNVFPTSSQKLIHTGIAKKRVAYEAAEGEEAPETTIAFEMALRLQKNDLTKGRALYENLVPNQHWIYIGMFNFGVNAVLDRMNRDQRNDPLAALLLPVVEILTLHFVDRDISVVFGEILLISLYANRYEQRLNAVSS